MTAINELDLIAWIRELFPQNAGNLTLGLGDDCAAFITSPGREMLITTDTLVEGTHFIRALSPPRLLGAKTANINMSDIAAMGGRPRFMLLSVTVTRDVSEKWMRRFLEGFKDAIAPHEAALIGGNVASVEHGLSFTVTAVGEIGRGRKITRSGARAGDAVCVTGHPGEAALGLDLLLSGRKTFTAAERGLIARSRAPIARVAWGAALAAQRIPSAMIDVSDGVALDLLRIAQASGVRARIELSSFPLSKEAARAAACEGDKAWRRILTGGEDYELLFTVPPAKLGRLESMIKKGVIEAARIGEIEKGSPDVTVIKPSGAELKLGRLGWVHGGRARNTNE